MKHLFFIAAFSVLAACSNGHEEAILAACVSEGAGTDDCSCMVRTLKSNVEKETYKTLGNAAKSGGADELAQALIGLEDTQRTLAGLAMGVACDGEDLEYGSERQFASAPEKMADKKGSTTDLVALCEARGNANNVCTCWADALTDNLPPETFQSVADGSLKGDEGYAESVNALPEEEQLKFGIVLVAANEACTQ